MSIDWTDIKLTLNGKEICGIKPITYRKVRRLRNRTRNLFYLADCIIYTNRLNAYMIYRHGLDGLATLKIEAGKTIQVLDIELGNSAAKRLMKPKKIIIRKAV